MDMQSFKASIQTNHLPENASVYLKAMWHDAKGDWDNAHQLIQDLTDEKASWIHAYLHRKEGDIGNADYWYRKARRQRPALSLQEEWQELTEAFL